MAVVLERERGQELLGVASIVVEMHRPAILVLMSTGEATTRPRRGDELELTIDSLAFGGAGVARLDGYVVFVAGAVPGDRVRALVGKSKRAYAEARTLEVLEPSPDRVPARA